VELTPGAGAADVGTGVPFLDHMMVTFARYSELDMVLRASGDLRHHVIEDVAITIGRAVGELAVGGVTRYGERTIPMDEALVQACVDLGGRPFYEGPIPSTLYDHWMRSFADNARATVHLRVLRGTDRHHIVEGAFKALGFAVRDALVLTDATVVSTKGGVILDMQ